MLRVTPDMLSAMDAVNGTGVFPINETLTLEIVPDPDANRK